MPDVIHVKVRTDHMHFIRADWERMINQYMNSSLEWYGERDPVFTQDQMRVDYDSRAFFINEIWIEDDPDYHLEMDICLMNNTDIQRRFKEEFTEHPERFMFIPRTRRVKTEHGMRVELYTVDAYTVNLEV